MEQEFVINRPQQRRTLAYREKSQLTGDLAKALAMAQGQFLPVEKDSVGEFGKFASLAALRKATAQALADNGLSISQEYTPTDTGMLLVTVLSHESDQWISSVMPIKVAQHPQQTVAYCTYMRRAAYAAILCLAAEADDDGAGATVASISAESQAWAEQKQLASDAIAAAANATRVEAVLAKVKTKIGSGEMNPEHLKDLEAAAERRIKAIEEAAKKAGIKPEGGAK